MTTEPFRYDDVRDGAPGEVGAPGSVEEFRFEPIKGYPMLQWRGKRPFTSTRYYPAQLKEVHGAEVEGWRNKIYWGDNLQVMGHLLDHCRGRVQLVYIDPPFDSRANYRIGIRSRGNDAASDFTGFEEKQYADIWTNDEYLQFLYERLTLIRELLAENGTVYVHLGTKVVHHVRLLMDEIFGEISFRCEIVWQKLRAVKSQTGHFANIHDLLLCYGKSSAALFHPQYQPLDRKLLTTHYRHLDEETGRFYNLDNFTQSGAGPARRFGDQVLEPPVGKHWIWSQERIDEGMSSGQIVFSKGNVPYVKRYFDESKGMRVGDIWTDVNPVNQVALERTDYPTQKPELLLDRIIRASSNPGDIVFDCFMGSGTTQAVAMKLGRRFIGADINLGAVQITTKRLIGVAKEVESHQVSPARQTALDLAPPPPADDPDLEVSTAAAPPEPTTFYTGFEVYNVNHYDVFRNPVEAKELLLDALEVHRLAPGALFDGEKDGRMVKVMPVNRIATRQDLNELITGLDYRALNARAEQAPNQPVERITLICMGHEPDLAATLIAQLSPLRVDVEVVDILRDRQDLQFKRDSEARIVVEGGELVIAAFYPMNLLGKLSLQKENVEDWRELVESVMIDWNYDGAVLQPAVVDIPAKDQWVAGRYAIPADAGTARVKITDLLSESLEQDVRLG